MKKSIKVVPKKRRGRPATGRDPHIAARMPVELIAEVEAWASVNDATRSEAFRRLVEIGLSKSGQSASVTPTAAASADRATELARKTVDRLVDQAAPPEEKAVRKRRLIKGPSEFRDVRVDRAGKK